MTLKHAPGAGGTRRALNGVGRSDKVPQNLTIELEGNEYHAVGAHGVSLAEDRVNTLGGIVLGAEKPLTLDDIKADWPLHGKTPDLRALDNTAKKLVDRGLLAQVGRGVRGAPHAYQAAPTARDMEVSIRELLSANTAYTPDAHDIAAHLDREVADVRVVLRGLVARGRVIMQGQGDRAIYDLVDQADSAYQPTVLAPKLEREVRDLLGPEPATPTAEQEHLAMAALMATAGPRRAAEVARASGLSEGQAGAALQALADRGSIKRGDTADGPVYEMWF